MDERRLDLSADPEGADERFGGGGGGGAAKRAGGGGGGGGTGAGLLMDVTCVCCGALGVVIDDDERGELGEKFSNCCDEFRFDLNEVEDADGLVGA